jgi:putative effector of murein hydrolase LrgA (UPF0299 family)
LTAGTVVGLVLFYLFFFKKWWAGNDAEEKTTGLLQEFLWLGAFIVACAVFPVVLSGR